MLFIINIKILEKSINMLNDFHEELTVTEEDINCFKRQTLKKGDFWKKWLLEEQKTGKKYIGYAYEIQRQFKTIQKKVTLEVKQYNSLREDGLTSL